MIAALALLAGLYPLAGWLGSALPRNPGWHEAADDTGITIMVESNGTHTGLVVPLITPEKDWRATFPEAAALRGPEATHLALGWGEHEVFLAVETWRDLTPLAALRIATIGGPSVMRATPYIRPVPSAWHRPLRLSRAQYARLVRRIEASLAPISPGTRPRPIAGTDPRAL